MMSLAQHKETAPSTVSESREDDDSPSSSPILVTRAEASRTLQSNNGDNMEYESATDFYHRRTGLQGIPGVGLGNATHIVR